MPFQLLIALLLAIFAWLVPHAAAARENLALSLNNSCIAQGDIGESLAAVAASPQRWDCGANRYTIKPERVFLRFMIDPAGPQPRYFVSSRGPLAAVHILQITPDGPRGLTSYSPDALSPADTGSMFRILLPPLDPAVSAVIVAIDKPTSRMVLEQAQLAPEIAGTSEELRLDLIFLAALCGLILTPIIFNASVYPILREPFVIWHCILSLSLMAMIVIKSPLANEMTGVPVLTMSTISTLAFGSAIAAAAMFAHSFIETDKLDQRLHRLLPWAAAASMLMAALHAYFPFVARPVQTDAFYLSFAPILALCLIVLYDALRNDSRAARFQLIGWSVLIIVGIIRIASMLIPAMRVTDAISLFYFGCVIEVIGTTLGIADRFMTIKVERDRARVDAHTFEQRAVRDPLTGLMNRRALEQQYAELRSSGFTSLAVLDIDHFKAINDTYGHATGDAVLCAVAQALGADENMLVVRFGGEEFVLLMRGADAADRAEHRRQSIPTRVAASVPGLDRMVTASMGLVEQSSEIGVKRDLPALFAHADRLLYEAKHNGRNRMMSEKLQSFTERRKINRRAPPSVQTA